MPEYSSAALQPSSFVRNLLILNMGTLGDVVLSLPAQRALRRHFQNSTITTVAGRLQGELLRHDGCTDKTITLSHHDLTKAPKLVAGLNIAKAVAQLQTRSLDLAISLDDFRESGWLCRLSGARERVGARRSGWAEEFLNTVRLPQAAPGRSLLDRYIDIAESVGAVVSDRSFRLSVSPEGDASVEKKLTHAGLKAGELLIGILPGTLSETEDWAPVSFAGVGARLDNDFGARILVLDHPDQPGGGRKIASQMQLAFNKQALQLSKASFRDVLAAVSRCTLFLTSDLGFAHVSTALDVPTLVLLNQHVDPSRVELRGARRRQIFGETVSGISGDEVFEAACAMLRMNRTGALFER